jgi:hypothetical protein
MIILYLLFALPVLLIFISGLTAAFCRYKSYPYLRDAIKFKHPSWTIMFASLAFGMISFLISWEFNQHHFLENSRSNEAPPMFDLNDIVVIGFFLLSIAALVCCFTSTLWCLIRLMSALLSHIRSLRLMDKGKSETLK